MTGKFDSTDKLCMIAGINLSAAGFHNFVQAVIPFFEVITVIVQTVIGVYSLLHIMRRSRERRDELNERDDRQRDDNRHEDARRDSRQQDSNRRDDNRRDAKQQDENRREDNRRDDRRADDRRDAENRREDRRSERTKT